MGTTRRLAGAAIVALLCVTIGCSDGDKAEGKKPSTTTTALSDCVVQDTLPEGAPEGAEQQATTTSIVQQCLDDAFTAAVSEKGSADVKDLSPEQLLGFGHGLCAYAQALAADPSKAPTYKELLASTAASWKVEPVVVEEMLGFAGSLCPDQLGPILGLKEQVGTVEITMEATGGGTLNVTYTGPDGGQVQDAVASPWTHVVRFDAPTDFRLSVTAESGEVSCSLKADDHQVTTATSGEGQAAECAASAADIRTAAGG